MRPRSRIAITGLGLVTPLGHDAKSTWESLLAGRSGVDRIRGFDASGFAAQIGAEVKDFPAESLIPDRKLLKFAARSHRFALAAAAEALADAGINPQTSSSERWGCSLGAGMMGVSFDEVETVHAFCGQDGEFRPDGLLDTNFPADPIAFCRSQTNSGLALYNPTKIWELREFRLTLLGQIAQVTTRQTPDASLNGTETLADFVNANQDAAKNRTHVVPSDFLAPAAPESLVVPWSAPGILDNDARHGFALSTCNGCHTGETGAFFTHVKNRAAGAQSALSGYLTGTITLDPVTGVPRTFGELAVRAADMQGVLQSDADGVFATATGREQQ